MILARASGAPVYQLDLWMVGEENCRALLYEAARDADLIIVEGVMGLFDGHPSAADLAELFGLPVLAVINAQAMAQTFPAVAYGLKNWRPSLPFAGTLANRVAGESHATLIKESLSPDIPWFGALRRGEDVELPSRHLGLVQAAELSDLDARLDRAAEALESQGAAKLPPVVEFAPPKSGEESLAARLAGYRLAVARDDAFSFIYQANLDLLERMGAKVVFFSPVRGDSLPEADGVYLPGGYPELFLKELSANARLREGLRERAARGAPILAECGGMLYLLEELRYRGESAPMAGVLPGKAELSGGLKGLGMMSVPLPEGTFRGHSFHHSSLTLDLPPLCQAQRQDSRREASENVYRLQRVTASYVHSYFPSNPEALARLLN
jgi:cobyrinic acid a,c-diamide synthase